QTDAMVFFFQAEDGIRDFHVTGVQTCALPISAHLAGQFGLDLAHLRLDQRMPGLPHHRTAAVAQDVALQAAAALHVVYDHRAERSEERRVGKGCRATGGGSYTERIARTRGNRE